MGRRAVDVPFFANSFFTLFMRLEKLGHMDLSLVFGRLKKYQESILMSRKNFPSNPYGVREKLFFSGSGDFGGKVGHPADILLLLIIHTDLTRNSYYSSNKINSMLCNR